jgi:hypothetical protein
VNGTQGIVLLGALSETYTRKLVILAKIELTLRASETGDPDFAGFRVYVRFEGFDPSLTKVR